MKKNASGEEKVKDNEDSEEIYCVSGTVSAHLLLTRMPFKNGILVFI